MMNHDNHTLHIKPRHRQAYDTIVSRFSENGYTVELAGSAQHRSDYRDIDLAITPNKTRAAQPETLERIISGLCDGDQFEMAARDERRAISYIDRVVQGRYRLTSGDAVFDLCFVNSPAVTGYGLPDSR